jgi:hypothetical protein
MSIRREGLQRRYSDRRAFHHPAARVPPTRVKEAPPRVGPYNAQRPEPTQQQHVIDTYEQCRSKFPRGGPSGGAIAIHWPCDSAPRPATSHAAHAKACPSSTLSVPSAPPIFPPPPPRAPALSQHELTSLRASSRQSLYPHASRSQRPNRFCYNKYKYVVTRMPRPQSDLYSCVHTDATHRGHTRAHGPVPPFPAFRFAAHTRTHTN